MLGAADLDDVRAVLARDPVTDVFVAARVAAWQADRGAGELWGYGDRGRLESLCWSGANLVPVQAGPAAVRAFADRARRAGRRCSSIVGPSSAVDPLWELLQPHWGRGTDGDPASASRRESSVLPRTPSLR